MSGTAIMSKPVVPPKVLIKPTKSPKVKARNERRVTYNEPCPWRSEASHEEYQRFLLSRPKEKSRSRYGTAITKPSANKLHSAAMGPTRKQDLHQATSRLQELKDEHEAVLRNTHIMLDTIEKDLAKKHTELRFAARLALSRQIRFRVLNWCDEIDGVRTTFMQRWQPASRSEMEFFANAKQLAESYICHVYEPHYQRYWKYPESGRVICMSI